MYDERVSGKGEIIVYVLVSRVNNIREVIIIIIITISSC